MKKKLITILLILILSVPAYSMFGLITKDDIQLVKAQIKKVHTEINDALVKISFQLKAVINMQAEVNAKVAAIDNSVNQRFNNEGDVNNTNIDPKLMYLLILCNALTLLYAMKQRGCSTENNLKVKDYKRSYYDEKKALDKLIMAISKNPDLVMDTGEEDDRGKQG